MCIVPDDDVERAAPALVPYRRQHKGQWRHQPGRLGLLRRLLRRLLVRIFCLTLIAAMSMWAGAMFRPSVAGSGGRLMRMSLIPPMGLLQFGDEVSPCILDLTFAVLSDGLRCTHSGYSFMKPKGGHPYCSIPNSMICGLPLKVDSP